MVTDNTILMQMARKSLTGKWGVAIVAFLVYMLITSIPHNMEGMGTIISLIISGPFALGLAIFSLSVSRNQETNLKQIFLGFNNFGTTLKAHLLIVLFIVLKSLLLIVPGVFAALSYSMTFYILADDNTLSARQSIKKSKDMMFGHRYKLFYLCMRFLGLALLCILTLGIGFLWLFPYMQVCLAKFYEDIKEIYLKEEAMLVS